MPSIDFDDDRPPRSRDELLAHVYRHGLRRRRARQGLIGGAAALLVLLLAAIPLVGGSESDERLQVAQEGDSTTTTAEDPTTTVQMQVVPETTAVTDPAPTTTVPPRTTTTLHCRNSYDERCGPFYWDPPPQPNDPLGVTITMTPERPAVGERVRFHVIASDPDGPVGQFNATQDYGDGRREGQSSIPGCSVNQPHGPWDPPPEQRGRYEFDAEHVYEASGQYHVEFSFSPPGGCGPGHPYASAGSGLITVTVSQEA